MEQSITSIIAWLQACLSRYAYASLLHTELRCLLPALQRMRLQRGFSSVTVWHRMHVTTRVTEAARFCAGAWRSKVREQSGNCKGTCAH